MRTLADVLWLLLLTAYIVAGMPLAPFHGDEATHIYTSRDFATVFIRREPRRLMTTPPYAVDSDSHLRLVNGSVNRYAIGLGWHAKGLSADALPPAPGWNWRLDYLGNVNAHYRPSEALLRAARLPSTLLLSASAACMFALGFHFGGRSLAYLVSALYTANPVVLLNGRRAMLEGSLLCFGLFTVLLGATIARRRAQGRATPTAWWAGLGIAAGLTLASKHSGVLFVSGAFGWILVGARNQPGRSALRAVAPRVALSLVIAFTSFIVLSPALWNDPPRRVLDLIAARRHLLSLQIEADANAPARVGQRVRAMISEPFIAPLVHFEVGSWAEAEPVIDEVSRYTRSALSGMPFGLLLGVPLTLLAGLGIAVAAARRYWGLLLWLAISAATVLLNPLIWQRYYLPFLPVVTLLAGLGLHLVARWTTAHLPRWQAAVQPSE